MSDAVTVRPVGRPPLEVTDYHRDIVEQACELLSDGKTFTYVAKTLNIPRRTLRDWMDLPEFAAIYARARELQADAFADKLLQRARLSTPETWQRDRLEVDTMKWLASKIFPKRYGEKLDVESSGTVEHTVKFVVENRKITAG